MAQTVMQGLKIDTNRLMASIEELGGIGAYKDEQTGLIGVNRLALTDQDGEGRRLVGKMFKDAGLKVSTDKIGNVYAAREGKDNSLAPVMIGSHIDSVPTAGRYDGCLGVLGGLEIIRTLNDAKCTTRRPLLVSYYTDEEGCRFGTDMLGSAVATGRIPIEEAYAIKDCDGITVKSELKRIGFLGDEEPVGRKPHAYLECHIEQGPTLRTEGMDIGIVSGVQAISWQELDIRGKAAHAGTTPMSFRNDAGVAAAKINLKLRDMIASAKYGAEMRATMGVIRPEPGLVNIIPGRLVCSVDLRNPSDEAMAEVESELLAYYKTVEGGEGVEISWRQTAKTPLIEFDASVQDLIGETAGSLGFKNRRILSGAGHDAQEWSRICKTAMVFVPGEHDGISHNPREFSTPEQCANGINVMLGTLLALADEG